MHGHDLFQLEGGFLAGEFPARSNASPTAGANRRFGTEFKYHRREPSAHPPAPCRRGATCQVGSAPPPNDFN